MAACAAATATAAEPAPTSPGNKKNHRNQRKYMFTNTVFIIQICQPKEQKRTTIVLSSRLGSTEMGLFAFKPTRVSCSIANEEILPLGTNHRSQVIVLPIQKVS